MDTPALLPLAERYGAERVWHAGIEANGWPPTWQPGTRDLMAIAAILEGTKDVV